jgi:L-aspartate oxidase
MCERGVEASDGGSCVNWGFRSGREKMRRLGLLAEQIASLRPAQSRVRYPLSFMHETDFLIIGTGAAGLSAALHAAELGRVTVLTKRSAPESNSSWAQGGIACVKADDDSVEQHVSDTLIAGAGLCKEGAVRVIASEGPARIEELLNWGVHFDQKESPDGHLEFDLTREGGHTRRRVLHHKDATGKEITDRLLEAVRRHPRIEMLENRFAIDLITTTKLGFVAEERVLGAYVLDEATGQVADGCIFIRRTPP